MTLMSSDFIEVKKHLVNSKICMEKIFTLQMTFRIMLQVLSIYLIVSKAYQQFFFFASSFFNLLKQ